MKNTILLFCCLLASIAALGQAKNKEYLSLIHKGDSLYDAKDYKNSAFAYSAAFKANGGKGTSDDRYNAACSWALAGYPDSSFFNLEYIAKKMNFTYYAYISTDNDLVSLHNDKRWMPLLDIIKQNIYKPISKEQLDSICNHFWVSGYFKICDPNVTFKDRKGNVLTTEEVIRAFNLEIMSTEINIIDSVRKVVTIISPNDSDQIRKRKEEDIEDEKRVEHYQSIEGKPMPDFKLVDMNNNKYELKKMKGKVIVLNFWFIHCAACVAEIPQLNKLVEKYKNNKDVVFIAPAHEDKKEALEKFLAKKEFLYKIIPNSEELEAKLSITSYPVDIVINKQGNIVKVFNGYLANTEKLEEVIDKLK